MQVRTILIVLNDIRVVNVSPNKHEEFYMVCKEWTYQFICHLYDGGQLSDGTYPGINWYQIALNYWL